MQKQPDKPAMQKSRKAYKKRLCLCLPPLLLTGLLFSVGCGEDSTDEPTGPTTWHVNYSLTPHFSIQTCLNTANSGDTCLVSRGTYTITEPLEFNGKSINLQSTKGKKAADSEDATILDGQGDGPVVKFNKNEQEGAIIDGFIIQNGSATGDIEHGGGIQILSASPTIKNCIITNNSADGDGGGVWIFATGANPKFINVDFEDNEAGESGGGYFVLHGTITLDNCTSSDNVPADNVPPM